IDNPAQHPIVVRLSIYASYAFASLVQILERIDDQIETRFGDHKKHGHLNTDNTKRRYANRISG
ncbi:hypothetical protein, partial [Oleiphilus sp. HI0067]|uniref:hypothetical protein n=1 Tax=Oleiphilus sp. HI0067 TaxID=1822243 RepID=UPI000B1D7299